MPLMIPETFREGPDSEQKVWNFLQEQLPQDWIVFHSKRFVLPTGMGANAAEGECDFLMLDPHKGIVGLEVKGGQIGRDRGGWYSVDRFGRMNRLDKDPGYQSQRATHNLARYLNDRIDFGRNYRFRWAWGVVFPDCDPVPEMSPELPRELVIGYSDVGQFMAGIERVETNHGMKVNPVPTSIRRAFIQLLAPELELAVALVKRVRSDEQTLIRLTEEQKEILRMLSDASRVAVQGSAGTGKTVVAMECARRWAAEGSRVLFVCYNRNLAEFLSRNADGFRVVSFHALCRDIAKAAGETFEPPKDPHRVENFWAEDAPQILEKSAGLLPDERFDAIVVDEGQDFRQLWWLSLQQLLRGSESRIWVFYDPQQSIYGTEQIDLFDLTPANLTFNCRNTRSIAGFANAFVHQEAQLRESAPHGTKPVTIQCSSEQQMVDGVRRALHEIVNEGRLEPSQVVVLSPLSTRSSRVWQRRRYGNLELIEFPALPEKNQVQFASLQSFKGLESDAIVLCELSPNGFGSSPGHRYVAASRAKHVLHVVEYAQ